MDNFGIIYRILRHLEASLDFEMTDVEAISHERLKISYERWEQLLIMLQDEGYIKGLKYTKGLSDDKSHLVEPVKPVITLKGLEYLSDNTMMRRAANLLKGVKDVIPGL